MFISNVLLYLNEYFSHYTDDIHFVFLKKFKSMKYTLYLKVDLRVK